MPTSDKATGEDKENSLIKGEGKGPQPSLSEILEALSALENNTLTQSVEIKTEKAIGALPRISEPAELAVLFCSAIDADSLALALSVALQIELAKHPGRNKKLISGKLLNYYAFKKSGRYRTFKIPKNTPGEFRTLKAPEHGLLRLQRLLLLCLSATFNTFDEAAHGFIPGRSVKTNSMPHVNRRYVLNLDLRNFFPSTHTGRVAAVLQLQPFGFAKNVAYLIANLCCEEGSLPQGAPTSPILTNIVCQRLDRSLRQLASRHNSIYTRYADDLTFSSNRPAFREDFHKELNKILSIDGYTQNQKKQRLQKPEERQEVTGIVVNKKIAPPREYIRQIRAMLHNWEKNGYKYAYNNLLCKEHNIVVSTKKRPPLERVIAGKISYLKMIDKNSAVARFFTEKLRRLKIKEVFINRLKK